VGIFTGIAAVLLGMVTGASWGVPVAVVTLLLAVGLRVVLTVGIVVAPRRRRVVPCACFAGPIGNCDAARRRAIAVTPAALDPVGVGVAGAASVVVAVVWVRLNEILELFAPSGPSGRAQARS
jgi:hypothetical protein